MQRSAEKTPAMGVSARLAFRSTWGLSKYSFNSVRIGNGNSKSGSCRVWADGVGDCAGLRGGGVCDGGAGSQSRGFGERARRHREEFGAVAGEGKYYGCG